MDDNKQNSGINISSLRFKFLIFFILLVLISSFVNAAFIRYSTSKAFTEELLNEIGNIAIALSVNLTDPIIANDNNKIIDLIFNEKQTNTDIGYIIITDENNKIKADTFIGEDLSSVISKHPMPYGSDKDVKLIKTDGNREVYDTAVKLDYGKGILRIGFYKADIDKTVNQALSSLIIGFLLSFLISIFFALLFSSEFLRPIKELKEAANKIAKGDFRKKIKVESSDELGELAKSFNSMSDRLAYSYDELKSKNENLLWYLKSEKSLKRDLESEKDRMQAVFSSVVDGIVVINNNHQIILLNRAAEEFLGISEINAIGRDFKEVLKIYKNNEIVPNEFCPVHQTLLTGNKVVTEMNDNFQIMNSSEQKIPVNIASSPLKRDQVINGAAVIVRDISSEKRLDESKSNFISTASHQLRTPLTAIRWFTEMLTDGEAGEVNPGQKKFLDRIYEGVNRMLNLISLLLQLARVEAGKVMVEPTEVDFLDISKGLVLSLKAYLDKKSQRVDIFSEPKILPIIPMDYEIVWEVIQNLVSNAIRYSPVNGIITINIIQKGEFLEYSVKDDGIGIPKEQQPRIFEKFFRAGNAVQAVPEGSGLGLSLSKLLVEDWGGRIWFESQKDKGATFFFTVPIKGVKTKQGDVKISV
jgi:two-component system sensor histidine kinase VicK